MGSIKISKLNLYVKSIDLTVWEGDYFWENEWFAKQNQWGSFRSVCSNIVLGPTSLSLISWFIALRLQKESREGEGVGREEGFFVLVRIKQQNMEEKKRIFHVVESFEKYFLRLQNTEEARRARYIYMEETSEWMRWPLTFEHWTSTRRSSGPHWCRQGKRSSLPILFSLHVRAPNYFFRPDCPPHTLYKETHCLH